MSGRGPFVFVVTKDSKAELRPVTLGERQENLVVISKGLQAGERVVVTGQIAVTPGGEVRFVEPSSQAARTEGESKGGAS
jgi:multidrug efflux pump subunit AcrA (membrane-fusion protein)